MKIKSCNHYGFTTDERILICKECITSQLDEAVREALNGPGDIIFNQGYAKGFASAREQFMKEKGLEWSQGFEYAREKAAGIMEKLLTHHNHRYDGGLTICSAPEWSGECPLERIRAMEADK